MKRRIHFNGDDFWLDAEKSRVPMSEKRFRAVCRLIIAIMMIIATVIIATITDLFALMLVLIIDAIVGGFMVFDSI